MRNGPRRPILDDRIGRLHNKLCKIINTTSLRSFSQKSGVSVGTLKNILSQGGLPGIENLYKIADAAEITLESLLGIKNSPDSCQNCSDMGQKQLTRGLTPILGIKASAGSGSLVSEANIIGDVKIDGIWLDHHRLNQSSLVGFYAKGHSMMPNISDGALLLVDTSSRELITSDIYVIRINEYLFAKRLHVHHSDKIDIISDNPAYPIETIENTEESGLFVVGQVVGVLQPPR